MSNALEKLAHRFGIGLSARNTNLGGREDSILWHAINQICDLDIVDICAIKGERR
jgi:hypothetical protein